MGAGAREPQAAPCLGIRPMRAGAARPGSYAGARDRGAGGASGAHCPSAGSSAYIICFLQNGILKNIIVCSCISFIHLIKTLLSYDIKKRINIQRGKNKKLFTYMLN
jgi:hypothetical protein